MTPQKNGVLILTGKSFGSTNLIALDNSGTLIAETMIRVEASREATITVQRGMDRESLSCTPNCQPSAQLGDAAKYFDPASMQADKRAPSPPAAAPAPMPRAPGPAAAAAWAESHPRKDGIAMQAVRFHATGSLDALRVETVPDPVPAPDMYRVAVHAAGLNPSDVKNVLGRFPYTTVPRIPGRDFAGIVVEAMRLFSAAASGARAAISASTATAATPNSSPFRRRRCDHAGGALFRPGCESRRSLHHRMGCAEACGCDGRDRLLVVGAGAVGRAATDLARAGGTQVHVAVRRPEQAEELKAIGLDAAAYPADAALPTGFDVAFETTGYRLPEAIRAIKTFGRVAIISAPPSGHVETPVLDLYRRGGSIVGVNSLLYDSRACATMLREIGDLFARGR